MGCGVYWMQVGVVEESLKELTFAGIGKGHPAYEILWAQRGALLAKIGFKFPRTPIDLMPTVSVSPESFRAWLDPEVGWVVMGRRKDGAPPVYHVVRAEIAIAVIKKEITPQLKEYLLTVDEYYGE